MRLIIFFFVLLFYSNFSYAIEFKGKFEQGSFILGKTEPNSQVIIDKKKIKVSKEGYFAFGLGRDRKNNVTIKVINKEKFKIYEKKVLKKNTKFKELMVFPKNKLLRLKKFMKE